MNFIIAVPFMGRITIKIALALAEYFKSDFPVRKAASAKEFTLNLGLVCQNQAILFSLTGLS